DHLVVAGGDRLELPGRGGAGVLGPAALGLLVVELDRGLEGGARVGAHLAVDLAAAGRWRRRVGREPGHFLLAGLGRAAGGGQEDQRSGDSVRVVHGCVLLRYLPAMRVSRPWVSVIAAT